MKENLNDLITFLTVVQEGSFTRAAVKSGTSQSAVSQTIGNLEARLQLKLLNRTTRSLTLTEAGERLAQLIGPAIEEISTGLDQLADLRDKPAGRVRISADEYAIQQVLWPKLAPVLKDYPDIHLELITDYGLVDIAKERFDAGVRRGGLIAQDMVAIPISAEHRMVVVASPQCLQEQDFPTTPAQLLTLQCINLQLPTHGQNLPWTFLINGQEQKLRVQGQVIVNGINQVHQACLDGYGLAYVPQALVQDDIASGRLLTVLDDFTITFPGYYLYYTSRLKSSAAFNIIVEALKMPAL
ncbi:TPA: LysR family transcriptional regulator [Citrobacter freundii]|uniref:LysR family transcriptional regulator n=1 Tax=Citrobacter freundii TaxID=546 RepID=UPI0015B21A89|nr:LysR family transcriptional regulator [Citrobacter freundii]ELL8665573.1 LysR family transcriptional regulator [Citrobacter freundii]MDE8818315.1 LysR family transcriptional regulator [Citrobacter freundii]MDV1854646.1 LysR family transcriptional regulator [Citrobacter freundii]MEB0415840.1 LysR family transcriptional regulator [Citrobacter freundii]MEB0914310.1 LysR family transcriptional regulator [Citrobacter freundii]